MKIPTLSELLADHKATKDLLKQHDALCLNASHFVATTDEIDKSGELLCALEEVIADKIYAHIPENLSEFFAKCEFVKNDLDDGMTTEWLNKRLSQFAASLAAFKLPESVQLAA